MSSTTLHTTVMFFPNGNTACFQNDKQVAELQEPWLLMYVAFLESKGIDPLEAEFTMPNGRHAKLVKNDDDTYNWSME